MLNRWVADFYFAGYVNDNLRHFRKYAESIASGELPYRDFPVEYPPVSVLFLAALSPFAGEFDTFQGAFIASMTLLSLLCWLGARASRTGNGRAGTLVEAALYAGAVLSVGPIALVSLDYIPALFTVLALVFLCRGKAAMCGAALGVATAAKGYPAVLVIPAVLIVHGDGSGRRGALACFGAWAAAALCFTAPAAAAGAGGFIRSIAYHAERGPEIASVYGAVLLLMRLAGLKVATNFDHGSWNVAGHPLASAAGNFSPVLTLILLALVYRRVWKSTIKTPAAGESRRTEEVRIRAGVAFSGAIAAFIAGFKVGSPQFLVWLAPFVPVWAGARRGWALVGIFAAAGHLQQWIFPWHWSALVHVNPAAVGVLLIEKLLLVSVFALILAAMPAHGAKGGESATGPG
ncbi:MAG: hypothetical protein AB1742_16355, partial [bacterium]